MLPSWSNDQAPNDLWLGNARVKKKLAKYSIEDK
jgi:hypothetical protein